MQAGTVQLWFDAPPQLEAVRKRLESIDPQTFTEVRALTGEHDLIEPIRVILSPEDSDLARQTPSWVAGFANSSDVIVLFPARSPSYPHDTLEDVLRHEVAHVMIRHSAGRAVTPRWFNEGLAMAAERDRGFRDQTQLIYQLATGFRTSLDELDALFRGGVSQQTRAYTLSGAIVDDLQQRYGRRVGATVLSNMRSGMSFDTAFAKVTGVTPAVAAFQFWDSHQAWTAWTPVLTSTTTLWMAVTIMVFIAIYRRWRRSQEIERRWEEEDHEQLEP